MTSATELWLSAFPVVGIPMLGLWVVSLVRRDVSVVDVYWGPGFALAALWYLWWTPSPGLRGWLATAGAVLWAGRLGIHLGVRWWRKGEEDPRYAAMREEHGSAFPLRSLFTVFGLQALLIWLLSPLFLAVVRAGGAPGALGWTGVGVFLFGLIWESVADAQLSRFKADPSNRGEVLDSGLWRYSRHPNYFGEAVLWWGIWLLALDAGAGWTVYVPVAVTLLVVRISGVPLLEEHLESTRPGYEAYARRTSAFIPMPPRKG